MNFQGKADRRNCTFTQNYHRHNVACQATKVKVVIICTSPCHTNTEWTVLSLSVQEIHRHASLSAAYRFQRLTYECHPTHGNLRHKRLPWKEPEKIRPKSFRLLEAAPRRIFLKVFHQPERLRTYFGTLRQSTMRVLTPLVQLGRLAYHLYTNDAGGKYSPTTSCIFVN